MLENPAMEAKPFYPSQQLFPTPMEQSTLKIYKTPNWLRKWRASDCFLVHLSRTRFFFCFFSHSLISRQWRVGGGMRNKDTALTKLPVENWLRPCPLFTYRCIAVNLHNVFSYFFILQPTPHPSPQSAGMLRGAAL